MTDAELATEWEYVYQERLGMLCPLGEEPTPAQAKMARETASDWCEGLEP